MTKRKSRVLKVTTRQKYVHYFPRVTQVLVQEIDSGPSQASLAADAGVDRAVLNQLCLSKAAASADLIGRLVAALPNQSAAALLKAYIEDVLDRVEKSRTQVSNRPAHEVSWHIHYPPTHLQPHSIILA